MAACRGGDGCGHATPRADHEAGGEETDTGLTDAADAASDGTQDDAAPEAGEERDASEVEASSARHCPKDMVNVAGRFCIDRYEDSLVDDVSGERLSPHYPPEPGVPLRMFAKWQEERLNVGPTWARAMPLPIVPEIEQTSDFRPRAVSIRGVYPQGYVSGRVAGEACARAKKRLCTHDEWAFACRGERQTKYPYDNEYQPGICNVFRSSHPAQRLHDNASAGHSDPRLGLVKGEDGPLLRTTGSTKECVSRWGKDSIYDMVGNEDEWIDDPDGTFVGGFFSRSTKEGCDSIVTVHPITHWDYSIGLRCCR
jgi:formylglycine-generating enzyme